MSSTEEIKARIDIVDLVSESVDLRRSGKNYTGFCPFHSNTRTPAFVVFPDTQSWHCFGQCNEGGDIFKFVMKKEGWDFPEALQILAERAGVQLQPRSPRQEARAEEHDRLRSLLEDAVTFYHHNLLHTEEGKRALDYCRHRGLEEDTLEIFGLGYAPDSWDALTGHFSARGVSTEDLLAAGLVSARNSGGVYDRFRGRLTFPIRDRRGRMAGFGARSLKPDDHPKYLNSPQTELFDKSGLLYGLDRARRAIRTADEVVIVEGYMDVIALHQAGYENAVSPMGTALTDDQLRQLKPLTRRIVLALDADAAGDRATLRGLQVAREALDREHDPVFDARGLLQHEARLHADLRVTTLPPGKDPDEVVREDPHAWAEQLESARPVVTHVMETLAAGQDLNDPKVKRTIADQVLPLITDLPDPIERDTYVQRLARLLQVDVRALEAPGPSRGRRTRRRRPRSRPGPPDPAREGPTTTGTELVGSSHSYEAHFLSVLLRRPDLIYRIDRELQEAGLGRLSAQDFESVDHQTLFRLIRESLDQEQREPVQSVLARLPLELMELADRLLARSEALNLSDSRVLDDLLRTIRDIRRRHIDRSINQVRFMMETAQEEGDLKAAHYLKLVTQHTATRDRLDRAFDAIQTARSRTARIQRE